MHNQSYRGWTCMMFPSCSTYKQLHWRRHYAMTRIYIRILLWNMLHEILTSCVAMVLSGFHSWSSCMRGCLTCFCPLQQAMWMYFRMRRRWYGTGGIAWGCRMTNVNIIYDIYIYYKVPWYGCFDMLDYILRYCTVFLYKSAPLQGTPQNTLHPGSCFYRTSVQLPAQWEKIFCQAIYLSRGPRCHFGFTCCPTLYQFWLARNIPG